MTTFTHTAIGYFIARGFATTGVLPDVNSTYLVSMLMANAPDVDGLVFTRRLYAHRENFYALSHYPISWAIVWSVMFLFVTNQIPQYGDYVVMTGFAILSHFILDTFDLFDGIAWFGPWIKTKWSFVPLIPAPPLTNAEWSKQYSKHWLFYIEITICILAFTTAFFS